MSKKKFFMYFSLAASIVFFAVVLINFNAVVGLINKGIAIAWPIILGLIIAFILNVIMSSIERRVLFPLERSNKKIIRQLKRPLAIILTLIVAFGFVSIVIAVIYPSLKQSIELIIKHFPNFMGKFSTFVTEFLAEHDIKISYIEENGINWVAIGEKVLSWVKNNTSDILNITTGVAGNIFGTIFDFILAFILAIYVLAGKERIRDFFHNLLKAVLKSDRVGNIEKVSKLTYASFSKFITGQITEALILGVLCAIGMMILKIPMVSVVSVIVAVTALIPMFGAWIGGAIGMFFILMVDPIKAIVFIVFLLILQQVEGNVIYPKVVGDSIGLPGILVLCAVTVGGGIAGIGGILFSVPITSVVYTLVKEFIEKKRVERNNMVVEMIEEGGHIEEVGALLNIENPEELFDEECAADAGKEKVEESEIPSSEEKPEKAVPHKTPLTLNTSKSKKRKKKKS